MPVGDDDRAVIASYLNYFEGNTEQPVECHGCIDGVPHHCVLDKLVIGWEVATWRNETCDEIKRVCDELFKIQHDDCMTEQQFRSMVNYYYKQRRDEP